MRVDNSTRNKLGINIMGNKFDKGFFWNMFKPKIWIYWIILQSKKLAIISRDKLLQKRPKFVIFAKFLQLNIDSKGCSSGDKFW